MDNFYSNRKILLRENEIFSYAGRHITPMSGTLSLFQWNIPIEVHKK